MARRKREGEPAGGDRKRVCVRTNQDLPQEDQADQNSDVPRPQDEELASALDLSIELLHPEDLNTRPPPSIDTPTEGHRCTTPVLQTVYRPSVPPPLSLEPPNSRRQFGLSFRYSQAEGFELAFSGEPSHQLQVSHIFSDHRSTIENRAILDPQLRQFA